MISANKAANVIIPIFFPLIGIAMFIMGFISLTSTLTFMATAEEITGWISSIGNDSNPYVYVTYEYDGIQYKDVNIHSYSSDMRTGQRISLYCDPHNPSDVQVASMIYFKPVVLFILATIFTAIGVYFLKAKLDSDARKRELGEQRISIYATVEEITCNTNFHVNDVHPYTIYCTYRDEYRDTTYRFKSERIWGDPSNVFPVGSTIEVLVNASDYSKYHVNVDKMDE